MSAGIGQSASPASRRARWLPWLIWLMVVLLAAATMALTFLDQPSLKEPLEGLVGDTIYVLNAIVAGLVGALIVSNRPGNRIGWILLAAAVCLLVGNGIGEYAIYTLVIRQGVFPGGLLAAWLSEWAWTPQLALLAFVLLLYPTGTFISPRWRFVAWAALIAVGLFGLNSALLRTIYLGNNPEAPLLILPNPIGVLDGQLLGPIFTFQLLLFPAIWIASFISMVIRFRRSQGIERQQLKWVTYAIALILALQIPGFFINNTWLQALDNLASLLLPIAIGIAILRHRLYDIDLLINRTLVYVPLTAILAGIFAASITLSQKLFVALTGAQSDAATVLTTLIVVAAVEPVKEGLQHLVERRFKEAPEDRKKFGEFVAQVQLVTQVLQPRQLAGRWLNEAVKAFGATGGAVYLQNEKGEELVHTSSEWRGETSLKVALENKGLCVGTLALGPRHSGQEYLPEDRAELEASATKVAEALILLRQAK